MQEMLQWVQYSNGIGFSFNGRARRKEFWYNYLFYFLAALAVGLIGGVVLGVLGAITKLKLFSILSGLLSAVVSIVMLYKMIPITVRRFHDIGKPGWWYIICMATAGCCGIGTILFIYLMVKDSDQGTNQYGPNPKMSYDQARYEQEQGMYGYQGQGQQYGQQQYGQQQYNQQQRYSQQQQYGQGQYGQNQYGQGQYNQGNNQYNQNGGQYGNNDPYNRR